MRSRLAIRMQVLSFAALAAAIPAVAQERAIEFPDVDGYGTFAVDLHTHSVFSDGVVWPIIRMQESERDGLALMAVTEHLEYQPWREDIPHPDRNRSYVVASEYAAEGGVGSDRGQRRRDHPAACLRAMSTPCSFPMRTLFSWKAAARGLHDPAPALHARGTGGERA